MKNKDTKAKKIILTVISLIIFAIFAVNSDLLNSLENDNSNIIQSDQITQNSVNSSVDEINDVIIYFIDSGQSDCSLISDHGEFALIDCGDNEHKDKIVEFLKEKDVKTLKYIFASHPHEDHIRGLSLIVDTFDVENIIMPKIQTNTKTFENALDSIEKKKLKIKEPQEKQRYTISKSTLEILTNPIYDNTNLNLASYIMNLNYGSNNVIFTGDCETDNEKLLNTDIKCDILKVAHHGSNTSSSEQFLKKVRPKISVIEVGSGNKYGHPKDKILERLSKYGIIYRTDINGTITAKIPQNGDVLISCQKN